MTLSVCHLFNFVYSTGEDELVQYSKIAQTANTSLITFDFAMQPSIMVNYTAPISFLTKADFKMLNKIVKADDRPIFVILKNENFIKNADYRDRINALLRPVKIGENYSLFFKGTQSQYQYVNIITLSQT